MTSRALVGMGLLSLGAAVALISADHVVLAGLCCMSAGGFFLAAMF